MRIEVLPCVKIIRSLQVRIFTLCVLATTIPALTQVGVKTGEFRLNEETTGYQVSPFPLYTSVGDFLVVWVDEEASAIRSRRVAADGTLVAGVEEITLSPSGLPSNPRMVELANGSILVVWRQPAPFGSDNDVSAIAGRLLSAAGAPLASAFRINAHSAGEQSEPSLATGADDAFVVWRSASSPGDDASGSAVLGRAFTSTGSPIGVDLQINLTINGDQGAPTIAADDAGFVVAFEDAGARLLARRLTISGGAVGAEFEVSSLAAGAPAPSITARPAAGFLVVWRDANSLEGRFLTSLGAHDGPSFRLDPELANTPRDPAVSVAGPGFAVIWTGFGAGPFGDDPDDAILGQLLDHQGRLQGGAFQVNQITTETQYRPRLAAGANGDFVVVWTSSQGFGVDSDYAVLGRLLDASGPLFEDDFESGGLSAWSSSVP